MAAVNPSSYNGILAITPDSEGFSGSSSQFRNHHAAAHLLTRGILEIRLFGAGIVSLASQAWGFLSISDFSDFGFIWLVRPQLLTMSQILVVKSWGWVLELGGHREAVGKEGPKSSGWAVVWRLDAVHDVGGVLLFLMHSWHRQVLWLLRLKLPLLCVDVS